MILDLGKKSPRPSPPCPATAHVSLLLGFSSLNFHLVHGVAWPLQPRPLPPTPTIGGVFGKCQQLPPYPRGSENTAGKRNEGANRYAGPRPSTPDRTQEHGSQGNAVKLGNDETEQNGGGGRGERVVREYELCYKTNKA